MHNLYLIDPMGNKNDLGAPRDPVYIFAANSREAAQFLVYEWWKPGMKIRATHVNVGEKRARFQAEDWFKNKVGQQFEVWRYDIAGEKLQAYRATLQSRGWDAFVEDVNLAETPKVAEAITLTLAREIDAPELTF